MDRLPYQATPLAAAYDGMRPPVSVLLGNVRSMYNVGAFFRTADGVGIERLYLSGITAHPPQHGIAKTALGAEDRVPWEYSWEPDPFVEALRARGCEIA